MLAVTKSHVGGVALAALLARMQSPHRFVIRRARVLAALGLFVVAGLLAGCAGPSSVADRVVQGLPDSLSEAELAALEPGHPDGEYVGVVWLEDGARFAV